MINDQSGSTARCQRPLGASTWERRKGGIPALGLLAFEAELVEFLVEVGSLNFEDFGGFTDVPVGFLEHKFQVLLFALGLEVAQGHELGDLTRSQEAAGDGLSAVGEQGGGQLVDGDGVAAEDDESFGDIPQLADVPGPGVAFHGLKDLRGDGAGGEFVETAADLGEVAEEQGHVLGPSAQGRDVNGNGGKPEVEVLAKTAFLHHFLKLAVGGGDDADIDLAVAGVADASHLVVFQDAQQPGLELVIHVADLIEKQGSQVGLFEQAGFVGAGIGEGAANVAEQLAFDEVGGDGGAVDLDEGSVGAGAAFVNACCDEFFAGATLAEDQNPALGRGNLVDELTEAGKRLLRCRGWWFLRRRI